MTKKDYLVLANALRSSIPAPHWDANKWAQYVVTTNRIADALKLDNSGFKRETFLKACGVKIDGSRTEAN